MVLSARPALFQFLLDYVFTTSSYLAEFYYDFSSSSDDHSACVRRKSESGKAIRLVYSTFCLFNRPPSSQMPVDKSSC